MTTKRRITKQKHERYVRSLNGLEKKPGRLEVSILLSSLNKEAAEELRGIAGNLETILAAPTGKDVATVATGLIARINRLLPQRSVADYPQQALYSLNGRWCEVEANKFLGIIMNVFPESDIVQYLMTGPSPHTACAPMSKVRPLMEAALPWPHGGQVVENVLPSPQAPIEETGETETAMGILVVTQPAEDTEQGEVIKRHSFPEQIHDTLSSPARTYTQIDEAEFQNLPNHSVAVVFAQAGEPVQVTKARKGRWVIDEEGTRVGNEEAWTHLNDHSMDGVVYRVDVAEESDAEH